MPKKSKVNEDRRVFLKGAGLFAVTLTVPAWVWGCASDAKKSDKCSGNASGAAVNEAWRARAAELEQGGIHTRGAPGEWAGKEGGHVPVVTFNAGAGSLTVLTKHGMSAEHWITTQYVKDQDGTVIGLQEHAGTDPKAEATFSLPPGTTEITAYSHCNKHGHWSADPEKAS